MRHARELYRRQGCFFASQSGLIRMVADRGFTVKWNASKTDAYVVEWERGM